jgi:hypothetical protein
MDGSLAAVRFPTSRGTAALALGGVLVTLGLAGCRPSGVRLIFAPRPGAVYRYRIHVTSTATTRLTGRPATTRREVADLVAVERVLTVDTTGARLKVDLTGPTSPPASYVVRVDRQAGLASIENVDGVPPAGGSGLQVQDLLPAVLGAPPDRPLHAGDRWRLSQPVAPPRLSPTAAPAPAASSSAPTRFEGSGRLIAFGVVHHRKVATTSSTGTIDVAPVAVSNLVGLQGQETVTTVVTRAVADGSIESDSARTAGTFAIVLPGAAHPGQAALVTGQLTVVTESTVERTD